MPRNTSLQFFDQKSLLTSGGSSVGVFLICGALYAVLPWLSHNQLFWRWVAFVLSQVVVFLFSTKATSELWKYLFITFLNGVVVFSNATGINLINSSSNLFQAKQSSLVPGVGMASWFDSRETRDSIATLNSRIVQLTENGTTEHRPGNVQILRAFAALPNRISKIQLQLSFWVDSATKTIFTNSSYLFAADTSYRAILLSTGPTTYTGDSILIERIGIKAGSLYFLTCSAARNKDNSFSGTIKGTLPESIFGELGFPGTYKNDSVGIHTSIRFHNY